LSHKNIGVAGSALSYLENNMFKMLSNTCCAIWVQSTKVICILEIPGQQLDISLFRRKREVKAVSLW